MPRMPSYANAYLEHKQNLESRFQPTPQRAISLEQNSNLPWYPNNPIAQNDPRRQIGSVMPIMTQKLRIRTVAPENMNIQDAYPSYTKQPYFYGA